MKDIWEITDHKIITNIIEGKSNNKTIYFKMFEIRGLNSFSIYYLYFENGIIQYVGKNIKSFNPPCYKSCRSFNEFKNFISVYKTPLSFWFKHLYMIGQIFYEK